MKKFTKLFFAALLVTPLFADSTLFYNGNPDGASGLANEINTEVSQANTYDVFTVPTGQTWNVTGLFSVDLMSTFVQSAEWEIRTGVSEGNGGTLLFSGTSAATQTDLGYSEFGLEVYNVTVSGLSGIQLGAGTYFLTVAPSDDGSGRSFLATTSGANCIGTNCGAGGNSWFNSSFFGANFDNTANWVGNQAAFSDGVIGNMGTTTPEPASLALLGLGALGIGLSSLRRRSAR